MLFLESFLPSVGMKEVTTFLSRQIHRARYIFVFPEVALWICPWRGGGGGEDIARFDYLSDSSFADRVMKRVPLQAILCAVDEFRLNNYHIAQKRVIFSGYRMGGAVAQIVALEAVKKKVNNKCWDDVEIFSLSFSVPKVFTSQGRQTALQNAAVESKVMENFIAFNVVKDPVVRLFDFAAALNSLDVEESVKEAIMSEIRAIPEQVDEEAYMERVLAALAETGKYVTTTKVAQTFVSIGHTVSINEKSGNVFVPKVPTMVEVEGFTPAATFYSLQTYVERLLNLSKSARSAATAMGEVPRYPKLARTGGGIGALSFHDELFERAKYSQQADVVNATHAIAYLSRTGEGGVLLFVEAYPNVRHEFVNDLIVSLAEKDEVKVNGERVSTVRMRNAQSAEGLLIFVSAQPLHLKEGKNDLHFTCAFVCALAEKPVSKTLTAKVATNGTAIMECLSRDLFGRVALASCLAVGSEYGTCEKQLIAPLRVMEACVDMSDEDSLSNAILRIRSAHANALGINAKETKEIREKSELLCEKCDKMFEKQIQYSITHDEDRAKRASAKKTAFGFAISGGIVFGLSLFLGPVGAVGGFLMAAACTVAAVQTMYEANLAIHKEVARLTAQYGEMLRKILQIYEGGRGEIKSTNILELEERVRKLLPSGSDVKEASLDDLLKWIDALPMHCNVELESNEDKVLLRKVFRFSMCMNLFRKYFASCVFVGIVGLHFAGKSSTLKAIMDIAKQRNPEEHKHMQPVVHGNSAKQRTVEVKMWYLKTIEENKRVFIVDFPGTDAVCTSMMDQFMMNSFLVMFNLRAATDELVIQEEVLRKICRFGPSEVQVCFNQVDSYVIYDSREENKTWNDEDCCKYLAGFKKSMIQKKLRKTLFQTEYDDLFARIGLFFTAASPDTRMGPMPAWFLRKPYYMSAEKLYQNIPYNFPKNKNI